MPHEKNSMLSINLTVIYWKFELIIAQGGEQGSKMFRIGGLDGKGI
jgi:hypothetical protein